MQLTDVAQLHNLCACTFTHGHTSCIAVVEFKAKCAHKLNETSAIDRLINCDSLLDDHVFPESECFKLDHTLPTIAAPTSMY